VLKTNFSYESLLGKEEVKIFIFFPTAVLISQLVLNMREEMADIYWPP
jgi:hypothetical protein